MTTYIVTLSVTSSEKVGLRYFPTRDFEVEADTPGRAIRAARRQARTHWPRELVSSSSAVVVNKADMSTYVVTLSCGSPTMAGSIYFGTQDFEVEADTPWSAIKIARVHARAQGQYALANTGKAVAANKADMSTYVVTLTTDLGSTRYEVDATTPEIATEVAIILAKESASDHELDTVMDHIRASVSTKKEATP